MRLPFFCHEAHWRTPPKAATPQEADMNSFEHDNRSRARAVRITEDMEARARYMAVATSIIPALAILAAAASLLMAAG
jgi:hypothetical protein